MSESSVCAPLRVVVIDDEHLARDELIFLLEQCEAVEVVGQGEDATTGLQLVAETKPDIAFVDLRMPGADGVSFSEVVRDRHPDVRVVVVSAHDDGAVRAFAAQVLDYLLKPVRLERLKATLARVRAQPPQADAKSADKAPQPDQLDRLAVRRRGEYVVLDIADVLFFEMRDELVWAVTQDDRFALDLTLAAVTARVGDDDFFRSHRSALVRVSRIKTISPKGTGTYELVMDHPESPRVPLARDRSKQLRERIPFAG